MTLDERLLMLSEFGRSEGSEGEGLRLATLAVPVYIYIQNYFRECVNLSKLLTVT